MDEKAKNKEKEAAVEAAEAIAKAAGEQAEERVPEEAAPQESEAEKALGEAEARAADYKDKWMRAAAEFENYKRRNAEVRRTAFNDGMKEVLMKILPVGDALDRALGMPMDDKTKEGVRMIADRFAETLAGMGVEEENPAPGDAFDPVKHDAVMQVEPEEGETSGCVRDVFVKGYRLDGKMIRYAQVRVVK